MTGLLQLLLGQALGTQVVAHSLLCLLLLMSCSAGNASAALLVAAVRFDADSLGLEGLSASELLPSFAKPGPSESAPKLHACAEPAVR